MFKELEVEEPAAAACEYPGGYGCAAQQPRGAIRWPVPTGAEHLGQDRVSSAPSREDGVDSDIAWSRTAHNHTDPCPPLELQERKTSRKDWASKPGPSKGTIFVPMLQMPRDALEQPKRFDWHYTLAVHRNTFSILPLHPSCPAWHAPQPCFQKGPEDRQHPGFS